MRLSGRLVWAAGCADCAVASGATPPPSYAVRSCLSASSLQALTHSPLLFQTKMPSSRGKDARGNLLKLEMLPGSNLHPCGDPRWLGACSSCVLEELWDPPSVGWMGSFLQCGVSFPEKSALGLHGSSHRGAGETNPTRIQEDLGSIPGLAQWVKDTALL